MVAYLVVGAESSGTKLMTSILIRAGCQGGADYAQPFDSDHTAIPVGNEHRLVWRRSVPYAGEWPDLEAMVDMCRYRAHYVQVLWMMRDWSATGHSQIHHGHVPTLHAARLHLQQAMFWIADSIASIRPLVDFTVISYDSLIARPRPVLDWIGAWIGLPLPDVEIRDENAKWLI